MITKAEIKNKLREWLINEYHINSDLTVDVFQDVYLEDIIEKCPIKFGTVKGDFVIQSCRLKTLENIPRIIEGNFICSINELKSLKGGPQVVGQDYQAEFNELETLEGISEHINGNLLLRGNMLKDLSFAPISVNGYIDLEKNQITNITNTPYLTDSKSSYINFNFNPIDSISLSDIEHLEDDTILCFCQKNNNKIIQLQDFYTSNNDIEISVKQIKDIFLYLNLKEELQNKTSLKKMKI